MNYIFAVKLSANYRPEILPVKLQIFKFKMHRFLLSNIPFLKLNAAYFAVKLMYTLVAGYFNCKYTSVLSQCRQAISYLATNISFFS